MDKKLIDELIADTTEKDIRADYYPYIERIGLKNFLQLAEFAHGDQMYIPKLETLLIPARNRRIRKDYNGDNARELAETYGLSMRQIASILVGVDTPGQMSLDDWLNG